MTKLASETVDLALADRNLLSELSASLRSDRDAAATRRETIDFHRRLAADVHGSLLAKPVREPRIDVDVRYLPINIVGSDYCQIHFPDPSSCCITMCHVTGDGIGPPLLASRISGEVRHFVAQRLRPFEVVQQLNAFMRAHIERFGRIGLVASFMAAHVDLESKIIGYCGAGHPSALIVHNSDRRVSVLESRHPLLGVKEGRFIEKPMWTHSLTKGDRLVFFTDGILETTTDDGERLAAGRLREFASRAMSVGVFKMADLILNQVAAIGRGPAREDITLVVAEIK